MRRVDYVEGALNELEAITTPFRNQCHSAVRNNLTRISGLRSDLNITLLRSVSLFQSYDLNLSYLASMGSSGSRAYLFGLEVVCP